MSLRSGSAPRSGRVLKEGRIFSAPARQDRFVNALLEAHDGAKHNHMRVAFDDLLDQAIEGGDRVREDRAPVESVTHRAVSKRWAPCTPLCPLKRCASA